MRMSRMTLFQKSSRAFMAPRMPPRTAIGEISIVVSPDAGRREVRFAGPADLFVAAFARGPGAGLFFPVVRRRALFGALALDVCVRFDPLLGRLLMEDPTRGAGIHAAAP